MKASSDLFHLIKSLSRREKSYFKRFSTLHSSKPTKNYLLLFAAMDKMDEYDDVRLKDQLKGTRVLANLSREKAYLYKLILRCLGAFHGDNSEDRKIRTLMDHARILMERNLMDASLKIIDKALDKARRQEAFAPWMELIQLKIEIYSKMHTAQAADLVRSLQKEKSDVMHCMSNLDDYVRLRFIVFDIQDEAGFLADGEEHPAFTHLEQHDLMQGPQKAFSLRAQERYYYTHNVMLFIRRRFQDWFYSYQEYIDFVESHPQLFDDAIFFQLYSNFLLACTKVRNTESFESTLLKMEELIDASPMGQPAERTLLYARILDHYSACGEFEIGLKWLPEIEERLPEWEPWISPFAAELLYIATSRILMEGGHYSMALDWLARYMQIKEVNTASPSYFVNRLLRTICHFELGDFKLVDHELRSIYRMLQRDPTRGPFQERFLRFLTKLPAALYDRNVNPLLLKLKDDLVRMASNPTENKILEYYHFVPWLESKITRRPFRELVKEYLAESK
jgi:hypothetical protein